MSTQYQLNTLIQLQATFSTSNGAPADPTTVQVSVKSPDSVINTYDPVRAGTGIYTYNLLLGQQGPWIYNWSAMGALQITSGDIYLLVQRTVVL